MVQAINAPAKVLLVDDEANVISALRRSLRPVGYLTFSAPGASAALGIMARGDIDVLITDMHMPGMDGSELLREVSRQWPGTVRILLTGYADLKQTTDAIRLGHVDHFMTKPWESVELLARLEKVMSERKNPASRLPRSSRAQTEPVRK